MIVPDRLAARAGFAAGARFNALGAVIVAALGVVFAVALAVQAAAIARSWGGGYWLFGCAAGSVVCALALLRHRHPARAAIAGLSIAAAAILTARVAELPAEPSPAMTLGLCVLVAAAVRALPARWAGAVAAAGLVVTAGGWLAAPPSSSGAVAVLNAAGWLAAVAAGLTLRVLDARRRSILEKVRIDERMALARELHDVVAHHITGIVVQAQAAQLVAHRQPETLASSLAGMEAAGSEALAAMRRVVGLVRDADADDAAPVRPGPEQVSDLVKRFDGRGPTVHLRLPNGQPDWPPEVASTVYRVVQESLTNVSSHAPHAASVTVAVSQDRQAITVEVADDAAQGPARYPHRQGYGLVGMRERVESLGGTMRAGPRQGSGWSVVATLPLRPEAPR